MRIAICDDEYDMREQLRKILDSGDLIPSDAEIVEFPDGRELLKGHAEAHFDIIFLDIEMGDISGLETAHEIRNTDNNVIIIFLTSHEQYVFQSFKIEAFDYLVKPTDSNAVNGVLRRAVKKYQEQHHIVQCRWQDSSYALEVNEIIYAEGYRRHVMFITKEKKYECLGKLNEYEKQLNPYGFLRCHQGFLINMNYIKSIENDYITTIYNQTVYMSTRKKKDCLKAFNKFLTKYRV